MTIDPPKGASPDCMNATCFPQGLLSCQKCRPYRVRRIEYLAAMEERRRIADWLAAAEHVGTRSNLAEEIRSGAHHG